MSWTPRDQLAAAEVIGHRMWGMWFHALSPTTRGERENERMISEKQVAFLEGCTAAWQKSVVEGVNLWGKALTGRLVPSDIAAAQLRILSAGTKPARRRLGANKRRLRRRTG
jgi:hypothetical protein